MVALTLRNADYARDLESLFPCPRQEELFTQEGEAKLLPWSWDEVLYGIEGYAPNFCLNCHAHLGSSIGGKVTYSCYHCKGEPSISAARGKFYYLQYSLGYSPELVALLIGEVSKCLYQNAV